MSYVGCVVKSITGLKELSFISRFGGKSLHERLQLLEEFFLVKKKKEKRSILSEHHLTNHLITEGDLTHSYVY